MQGMEKVKDFLKSNPILKGAIIINGYSICIFIKDRCDSLYLVIVGQCVDQF